MSPFHQPKIAMQRTRSACRSLVIMALAFPLSAGAQPLIDSWFTGESGRYARLYETAAEQSSGASKTTWSRGSVSQSLPAYSGVQAVYSSADWVYIHTSGLGIHTMGPWYLDAAKSNLFPNLPHNTKTTFRLHAPSSPF